MANEFNPKHGAMVVFPFKVADATTGESATDLTNDGGASLVVMPKAGSIVGIAGAASAAITAGTMTLTPHKDSVEFTDVSLPTAVLSSAAQESYAAVRPRALTFDAGDVVGISVTTTTTLDPTNTLDVDAQLYVIFDND